MTPDNQKSRSLVNSNTVSCTASASGEHVGHPAIAGQHFSPKKRVLKPARRWRASAGGRHCGREPETRQYTEGSIGIAPSVTLHTWQGKQFRHGLLVVSWWSPRWFPLVCLGSGLSPGSLPGRLLVVAAQVVMVVSFGDWRWHNNIPNRSPLYLKPSN